MSLFLTIHPEDPQPRLINQAISIIRRGGVVIFPTDSAYAIGCKVGHKPALDRIRQIRDLHENHHFTLMCRDLSELATYAHFDNNVYRLLKSYTPGPFTFLLRATKEVPSKLRHPKRRTIGLRVPDNAIALSLLESLGEPMTSVTLVLPGDALPLIEPAAMRDLLGGRVDLIIDGGPCGIEPTTVVDLISGQPEIVRQGKGDLEILID